MLRAEFNTVYIAPVMLWKCSQPLRETGIHFGYIVCSEQQTRQKSQEVLEIQEEADNMLHPALGNFDPLLHLK